MSEWKLRYAKTHYVVHDNGVGLTRIKCRHCEYVVIAEKRLTLLALNLMHEHLKTTHSVSIEDVDK